MRPLHALAVGALVLPLSAFAADPHSYAQPDQVRVTHLDLDLKIDFPHKQLDGTATFADPRAPRRVLDEVHEWCSGHHVRSLDELIGTAHG